MIHIYKEGKPGHPVLLLLHGTGGNEESLLGLGRMLDPDAGILSLRGAVLEQGMPRFFKRLSEGVFDEEDLLFQAEKLRGFLEKTALEKGFSTRDLVAVGYSNGANMATALLLLVPDILGGAILHHPMVPLRNRDFADLKGLPIFVGAGINDPLCSEAESLALIHMLEGQGAAVESHFGNQGHSLSQEEFQAAKGWYGKHFGN